MKRKLAVMLLAALVALGAGELALRVAGLPRPPGLTGFLEMQNADRVFATDPDVFWRLRAGNDLHYTNRLGLRGWLPPDAKRPHDFRIACVGDSCTFGLGVRYEEAWGMVLERSLQAAHPGAAVQTILAGLPGFSTYQSRVLFDRDIAALAPDVTVFYCGAWNDYVPCVERDDAARAARDRSALHSLRLAQILARATAPDLDEYVAALRRGEAPDGRRVSLADYRANLNALVDRAVQVGSAVLFVVAPCTARSAQRHPIALEYRAATREIAAARGVAAVDAARLFEEHHATIPADWRGEAAGEWPYLMDSVHPTAAGHAAIAAELEPLVARHLAKAAKATTATQPELAAVVHDVSPLTGAPSITLRGGGLATADAFDRVFAGPWWIPDVRVLDDGHLQLELPRSLPPGDHRVELRTARGVVHTDATIRVEPVPMRATITRTGDELDLQLRCAGPPGWRLGVWFGDTLRDLPARTAFGPFWLTAAPDGRPPGFATGPFRVDRLTLPQTQGEFDRDGVWNLRIARKATALGDLPATMAFQGIILHPDRGFERVMTGATEIAVPR